MSEELEFLKPTSLEALWREINRDLSSWPKPYCPYEKLEPVHKLLTDNQIVELQEFIDKHRVECGKNCLADTSVRSAKYKTLLRYALSMKQFTAYAVLLTNFIKKSAHHNEFQLARDEFEKLDEKELEELRAQIRKRFIRPDAYIELATDMSPLVKKLMLKTRLASNYFEMKVFHELRQRYEKLETMDQVRPMLVIIAASEGLEIACDFFEYTVMYMQPKFGLGDGLCYFKINLILLACKGETSSTLSTPVHEFLHYLMNVIYDNESMPCTKNDSDRKAEYSKAFKACEAESRINANSNLKELKIFRKFSIDSELERKKRAEAICLPATLPIDYSDRATTMKRYAQCLAPMITFYNQYTLPDIIKKAKEIEAEWEGKAKI